MTNYTTQSELQRDVAARLRGAEKRLRAASDGLLRGQLAWNPPEGGWSIAQVFEHLCVTDEAQFSGWERVIRSPNAPRKAGEDTTWYPRLAGKFIVGRMVSPSKSKTPPKFNIGTHVRTNVAQSLFAYIARVLALLEESTPLEWCKVKFGSAALPFLRYNLGDTWLIEAVHLERHAGQVERIRGHAQFPKA